MEGFDANMQFNDFKNFNNKIPDTIPSSGSTSGGTGTGTGTGTGGTKNYKVMNQVCGTKNYKVDEPGTSDNKDYKIIC